MPGTSLPGTGLACTPARSLENVLEAFSLIANYLTGETYGAKEASLAPTPDRFLTGLLSNFFMPSIRFTSL